MNGIVGEEVEGIFDSFVLAGAYVPVVTPAMAAKVVDLVLGGPDEDDEPMDEQPRGIPTLAQAQETQSAAKRN